ncbi:Hypothetical protein LUCI_2056 [Lucifera butyrica]|uniref:Uncharacterized protein n=1 Tax=Lucifera butyrica TaxID=1351585 RepID=A0A498R6J2_9FIRM|nr:hypothetical protein [Lucifera butyrica]VBB06819.1 Hypothetical protein LUCI_2056 [Lucifera butyrica]
MANEHTIIAHFPSSTKAAAAKQALAAAGLTDAQVRRNSRFGVTQDENQDDPVAQAETLTGLTLFSANNPNDANASTRVLMGADPSVSGFSMEGYGLAGGRAFTLVTFVPEERMDEAVTILKQNGGEV